MMNPIDWIIRKFFGRWFKVVVTDPEEIERIKAEFGITHEVWIAPLPPEADHTGDGWKN